MERGELSEHIKSLSVLINTDTGGLTMVDDAIRSGVWGIIVRDTFYDVALANSKLTSSVLGLVNFSEHY